MTCVVCGQRLIEPARAPRQPDRHRWCSTQPGRRRPCGSWGLVAPVADLAPADDLTPAAIAARLARAEQAIRARRLRELAS